MFGYRSVEGGFGIKEIAFCVVFKLELTNEASNTSFLRNGVPF